MDPLTMPDRLSVRFRSEDRELLDLAARRNRMRLSEWVRRVAIEQARQAIARDGHEGPKAA